MTNEKTYTRTPSGASEAAAQFSMLRAELKEVLELIGSRITFVQLKTRLPQLSDASLQKALEELSAAGYLETNAGQAPVPDLDITRCLARPVKVPTVQRKREAEQLTLAGMPSLKQAGYFVSILSRPARRIAPRSGDTYHVFIIDADESNTLVSARTLLLAGFDTHVAVNRDEIVTGLNRQPPPDVIAMDVILPDVIGLELLGRLREHELFKTVPIIVMTSKSEHDDVVAALAYGASSYMTKPFKPEALLESVKAVLGIG